MTRFRNSVGASVLPQDNSTNWKGFHDHLLPTVLAIEGEPGYDPHVMESTERKNSEFMTRYGIFDSGLPHEGYAYFTFGMTWMSPACFAITRRSELENLMETTRFYQSIETAFRLLDRDGIRSHHDVVGDSTSGAGLINLPPRQVLLAKYLWPEDRMIDYLWKTLSRNLLAAEDRRFGIFEAMWGEDVAYPEQTLAEAAEDIAAVKFCPDRGVVLARDRWDEDGLRLDFRCRMDKYNLGHQHSDVNAFELWGEGRIWIIDRGKFGGTVQEAQSCILIDGVSAFSAGRNSWPSTPGRFVEFRDDRHATIACGDAKPFFEWSFNPPEHAPKIEVEEHRVIWSDYYFPRDVEVMPAWMAYSPITLNGYGQVKPLYKMNPVQRAYRTAVMLKGKHPAVVIVDDYQKDDQPHDYVWMANVPFKESMVVVSQDAGSLVLRHKDDSEGPFLLVKVLNAAGLDRGIRLNRAPYKVGKEVIPSERIEIPCSNVVAPDYRVLLYPFAEGDPLPEVNVQAERITIAIGKQEHCLDLERVDGRSKVTLRNSLERTGD